MSNKTDGIWILTANNFYSYESMEQQKAVFTNKKDALNAFNQLVFEYYEEEINMTKEMLEIDVHSLDDIINETTKVSDNFYMNDEYLETGFVKIKFLDYKYGLEISEDKMKCTISRIKEQMLPNYKEEKLIEEVYIILEKLGTDKVSSSSECLLDNYKDLDNYIKNLK